MKSSSRTSYVHIDSARRRHNSVTIWDDYIWTLPPNALLFRNGSYILNIYQPDHVFKVGDEIALSNVVGHTAFLANVVSFKKGSQYLRIKHANHGLTLNGLYDPIDATAFQAVHRVDFLPKNYHPEQNILDGDTGFILKLNSELNFTAGISGFHHPTPMIGNIAVNSINQIHQIFLLYYQRSGEFIQDPDSYLILLNRVANLNFSDQREPLNVINVNFNTLYGVPLAYLNSANVLKTVLCVNPDSYDVRIECSAIVGDSYPDQEAKGGGTSILVRRLREVLPGYPNPNNYTIQLDRTYQDVVQIRVVASIFTNSQKMINESNNRLYWKNLTDGDHVYNLSIAPGNYQPSRLARAIQMAFGETLRNPLRDVSIPEQTIVSQESHLRSILLDPEVFDESGHNKYHLVEVQINPDLDLVSMTTFREVVEIDTTNNPVIKIPSEFLRIYMNMLLTPFITSFETITFFYITSRTHIPLPRLEKRLPNIYGCLYAYKRTLRDIRSEADSLTPALVINLVMDRAVLVNFFRYQSTTSEINSINTPTRLESYYFDGLRSVTLPDHNLQEGDLIITDKFSQGFLEVEQPTAQAIYVYEIKCIVNNDSFEIDRVGPDKYRFIYDDQIINFEGLSGNSDWLKLYTITQIEPSARKTTQIVRQTQHGLEVGTSVRLSQSNSVNGVPADTVNGTHIIQSVLDENHYVIKIDHRQDVNTPSAEPNMVSIIYPDYFQLQTNLEASMTNLLGFDSVDMHTQGFQHTVTSDNRTRLSMTGPNYFYITSPELGNVRNTGPVENVFAIVRWMENPGGVIFDTHEQIAHVYQPPIENLSQLTFKIMDSNGKLIEFNGVDHTLTLEITESSGPEPEPNSEE